MPHGGGGHQHHELGGRVLAGERLGAAQERFAQRGLVRQENVRGHPATSCPGRALRAAAPPVGTAPDAGAGPPPQPTPRGRRLHAPAPRAGRGVYAIEPPLSCVVSSRHPSPPLAARRERGPRGPGVGGRVRRIGTRDRPAPAAPARAHPPGAPVAPRTAPTVRPARRRAPTAAPPRRAAPRRGAPARAPPPAGRASRPAPAGRSAGPGCWRRRGRRGPARRGAPAPGRAPRRRPGPPHDRVALAGRGPPPPDPPRPAPGPPARWAATPPAYTPSRP